jgi:hypothetical protein
MDVVQEKLEEIMTRLDMVSAEVQSRNGEIHGFHQQMEDFGTDLDGVKHKLLDGARAATPPPPPQPPLEVPPHGKGALVNHGAPLLGTAPAGATAFTTGPSTFHTVPSSPLERDVDRGHTSPERDDLRVRPPRHDFHKFSGHMPLLWIDQSMNYFEMFRIPPDQWVGMAMLYFEGHAALWYQAYPHRQQSITWEMLTSALVDEFGQGEYEGQMNKLMQLRQNGTVAEHKQAFEESMYHLISLDEALSTHWSVSKFVFGLKDDIHTMVRLDGAMLNGAKKLLACS